VSLSKRPPIVLQQNDRTIELRKLADEIDGAEWEDEEITAIQPQFHIHMPKPERQSHAEIEREADTIPSGPPSKLGHFRAILGAVPPAWRGPVVIVAILAIAAAVVQGVKLPW
jgi:hypothetical protein